MPQARSNTATDTTSVAQGRFTVQLPAELRDKITALGKQATAKVKSELGMDIDLSMAQIVGAIINAQHEAMTARESQSAEQEG